MTDDGMTEEELIEWLRETDVPNTHAAADALEAKDKQIAWQHHVISIYKKVVEDWSEGFSEKCARIAELEAALNSISLCSQNSASSKEECGRIARAARAALEKKE